MRHAIYLSVVILLFSASMSAQERGGEFAIIPTPQKIIPKEIRFRISGSTKIVLGADSKQEQFAAQQINEDLGANGEAALKVVAENSLRKFPSSFIFIGTPGSEYGRQLLKERKGMIRPEMKAEGYFLDVAPAGIAIIAESEAGKFYGVMTLLQMMRREKRNLFVDGATIFDFPLEKIRGITDDISRGQISTLENFEKIIRFVARYKMNTYSPYIEDMFEFAGQPLVGKGRGALTASEVKELDAYAKKYFVDMVPIFETLGHWENILAMPQYLGYAEFPGAHTLNVSDERVYGLLDEMIGELCNTFSSPYFNMAADESWDVGLGASKQRVQSSDLATVHAEHYKRVIDIIKKYGKKPMMYGDIILNDPAILGKIPKDVVIVDWHYDPEFTYPSPLVFKQAGFPFIVSPAVWNFMGPFPDFYGTFVNIRNFNRDGYENGSSGLLTSNWNDYGGEELRELNYYGYAWTAECAWQPEKAEPDDFNRKFFEDYFGPNNAQKLRSVYAILSSPANLYSWHELWRHPMLPLRPQSQNDGYLPVLERIESIKETMPLVLELLADAKGSLKQHSDQVRYLEFVARLNLWFAKKVEIGEEVKRLAGSAHASPNKDSVGQAIAGLCTDVAKDLALLKNEFEGLWLSTNRSAGLEYLLARYDRQLAYWQEKIDQVKSGAFTADPVLESSWIYHPNAHPGIKDTTQVRTAFFRKNFWGNKGLRSATLQLIGDT
ncbi:MAG TPA: glycoside hydrolase family 20 zincin-like fold domain-containing protein, partial [Bacteroidota bacterium]|nr:glycoside hydrolase family 20 zincin-like fold domain-containing protein [Bacteroidota bacterium]